MANIIWNKNELTKIRKIIINKTNYVLGTENNFINNNRNTNYSEINTDNTIYSDSINEIKELFYIQDRDEITSILNYLNNVEADYNNPLHYGLIACLDKIDINDHTYIFEILKQIISQYERVISNITKSSIAGLNSEEVENIMLLIEQNKEESDIEKQIRITMDEILNVVPRLKDINVYNSIIEKINGNIKNKILIYLNSVLIKLKKKEEFDKNRDIKEYNKDLHEKYTHKKVMKYKRSLSHNVIHR